MVEIQPFSGYNSAMNFLRNLEPMLHAAMLDTPAVLINGARQVGKSTLAKALMHPESRYETLDAALTLAAASHSPEDFVEGLGPKVVLDEIQRVPELLLAIKKAIDEKRTPGRFLLTGSANVMTLPKVADSLAGRIEIHTLWPLSQGEIEGRVEGFIDACFGSGEFETRHPIEWMELADRMTKGGYPEAVKRSDPNRRQIWFESLVTSIIERDLRELGNIEGLRQMPLLLRILAARAAGLQNFAEVSRITQIPASTLKRYVTLFSAIFLHTELPGWYRNIEKKLLKSPKTYLNDTGLLCSLLGVDAGGLTADRTKAGPILENFVVMELIKQRGWSRMRPRLYHMRTQAGKEVDLVLEAPDGRLVGIEIKASSKVGIGEFADLKAFAEMTGDVFVRGIVLHTGKETASFGPQLVALPISSLWRTEH